MTRNRESIYAPEFDRAEYYKWLCQKIYDPSYSEDFELTLRVLFDMDYIWSWRIPKDENRAVDGINLRDEFADICGVDYIPSESWGCTVLEMLIALSIKIEERINDLSYSVDNPAKWFWEFCYNLDILRDNADYISQQVNYWLNRQIGPKGEGSPFPIKYHHGTSMTKADIWLQINYYLSERLGLDINEESGDD